MMNINNSTPLVYIVDDEFAVRDSMTILIESTGRMVKNFDSANAFLGEYEPERPSCLILDIRMPEMTGHELQEALLEKGIAIPIIFISGHADVAGSAKAFRAGAIDFLEKPFSTQVLLERIDEALKKDIAFRDEQLKKRAIQGRIDHLTAREKEVMGLIVKSYSNKESAKLLHISNRTVDVHRASIMNKMHADNIAELIAMVLYCESPGCTSLETKFQLGTNETRPPDYFSKSQR